ncbi:MAG: glycoside hydrolase family 88 protein [Prolixibacteraceae bacterium]
MKKIFATSILLMLFSACFSGISDENPPVTLIKSQLKLLSSNLKDSIAKMPAGNKVLETVRSLNPNGTLKLIPSKDWCSGFFPGTLWLAANLTNDQELQHLAAEFTIPLEPEKFNGKTHDMGFKMMSSFGQGYRLTKDSVYRNILIQSAKTLTKRFNENAGVLRSWDHSQDKWAFPVIIDNMMNLELLFWASRQTGDPQYYNIAVKHAETTLANHFRADNSSYHVVDYDSITGKVIKKTTHQGYSDASAWARGQAWGLYGYTMCYRETGIVSFLYQAEKIAAFILNHPNLPADKIPYWDFDVPKSPQPPRDVSAATVIASALYELAGFVPSKKEYYIQVANTILTNLQRDYLSKPGSNKGFLLDHSTGSFPQNTEVDVPIIYADYYYLEALSRQKNLQK